jgi:hypothetical protein
MTQANSQPDWTDELLERKLQGNIVYEHWKRADEAYSGRRDQNDEWYNAYRTFFESPDDGMMSELGVPLIFSDVESYMPRLAANKPEIGVWPRSGEDVARAAKHRVLIDYQWEALRMGLELIDYVKTAKIYGTAIWFVDYSKEVRNRMRRTVRQEQVSLLDGLLPVPGQFQEVQEIVEGPEVTWDGPRVYLMDPDEVLPDPDGWNIDSCSWIIHKKKTDLEDVLASLEAGEEIYEEKAVREIIEWLKKANPEERDSNDLRNTRQETFGETLVGIDPHKRVVTELVCWYDGKVVSIIKENPKLPPLQYRLNPLGRKPFIRFCPIPLPKEFYGISLVEVLYSLAVELNVLHGARLDNLLYAAHRMFKILRTSNIEAGQLEFRPGGALYVDDMRDIEELQTGGTNFALYRETDELRMWAQKAGGSTDTFQGIEGGGTATEANLLAQASGSRAGLMFKILSIGPLYDLGEMLVILNEIYMTEAQQIRVTGDRFSPLAFEEVRPEDLVNRTGLQLDLQIDVATTEPESRQLRLQRSNAAMQTFGNLGMPLQHPLMERLLLEIAEGFGFDNAGQLIEEGREVIAQQQAAAQAQEGQPDQGGSRPAGSEAELLAAENGAAEGGVI